VSITSRKKNKQKKGIVEKKKKGERFPLLYPVEGEEKREEPPEIPSPPSKQEIKQV